MNKRIKKQKIGFISYYDTLDPTEKKRVREEFLKESELSYPAWFTKIRRNSFTALERKALGEICKTQFANA